jgi:methionyl-tRNA formyltransferase
MKNTSVVFMGTPEFSVPLLEALINECNVIGVVCQPDSNNNKFSPIKEVAIKNNITLFQPENIKNDYQNIIEISPDIIITCAYGQFIPKVLLDAPRLGCVNVHASLLPKLRGGAPIHRAIINGETRTGITIQYMAEKMDAGAIIRQCETEITNDENVGMLHDRLSIMGRDLMIETLPDIISGNIDPVKQKEEEVTFAWTIKREDEHINFEKSKREIYNLIRGLNPWPGAYCLIETKVLKVWNSRISDNSYFSSFDGEIVALYDDGIGVKVNSGEIIFTEVQLEGRKKMSAKDFLNGLKDKERLIGKILE